MNDNTRTTLAKIQKVSKRVRAECKILIVLLILLFLIFDTAIIYKSNGWTIRLGETELSTDQLTTKGKTLLVIFIILAEAVLLKGLYHLHTLFSHYASGHIFTEKSVRQFRQIGITFLLDAALESLGFPLGLFLMQPNELPQESIPLSPFKSLFIGGIVILISWVMDEGRGLYEENQLTI